MLVATTVARAQPIDAIGDLLGAPVESEVANTPASARQTVTRALSVTEQALFASGLASARRGDVTGARSAVAGLSDRVARKTITWALVDASSGSLSFYELDAAR